MRQFYGVRHNRPPPSETVPDVSGHFFFFEENSDGINGFTYGRIAFPMPKQTAFNDCSVLRQFRLLTELSFFNFDRIRQDYDRNRSVFFTSFPLFFNNECDKIKNGRLKWKDVNLSKPLRRRRRLPRCRLRRPLRQPAKTNGLTIKGREK